MAAPIDVTNFQDLRQLFLEVRERFPSVLGIFHSATVLDDRRFVEQTAQSMKTVLAPKIRGAWNLHELSKELCPSLQLFVLFSSTTAMVGNPGQANYVAGNCFLEALAEYRRSRDLPALTVNWGALEETGLAARDRLTLNHLDRLGISAFSNQEALTLLGKAIDSDVPLLGVMNADWEKWGDAIPRCREASKFQHVIKTEGEASDLLALAKIRELQEQPETEKRQFILQEVKLVVAQVLRMDPSKLTPEKRTSQLGIDSLMGVEMHQLFKRLLGVEYPTMEVLKGPSLKEMADYLYGKICEALQPSAAELLERVDELSEAEIDALLAQPEMEDLLDVRTESLNA